MIGKQVARRLARAPMFTAVAAMTLAIGIGANSTVFSVINGILIKPLPYSNPASLIEMSHTAPGVNFPDAGSAPFLYFTYREQGRSFERLGLYSWSTRSVTGLAEPEEATCLNVTADVLPILDVRPALGRWFSDQDVRPGSPLTMILSGGWWQARFGGDPLILGRRIVINGVAHEVIGVMPAAFRFQDRDAAFLLPLQLDRSRTILGDFDYRGIARLKPGVTIPQASADVARMIPIALGQFPPSPGLTVKEFEDVRLGPKLRFLKDALVGDVGKTLWVLMGTIGLVLLIACANVANLLMVRAEGRQQELAVRAALGATRRDLARELLAESAALGLLGGVLGLGLAAASVRVLIALAPAHLPRVHDISIDSAVMLFTLPTALLAGLSFGMIAVAKYAEPRVADALRGGGRTSSQSRERLRARSVLVVVQVALAVVLLVGSGLMIRTFQALRRVDPGFDPRGALTLRITIPESLVSDGTATIRLEQAILDRIRGISDVTSIGITSLMPTEPGPSDLVYARDKTYARSVPPLRRLKFISPGLLAAIGNRLIAGRDFTWTDTYERRPVAMVSENLARELWQDPQQAIGKEIREDLKGPWRQVVGVVSDEREDGVQAPAPTAAYYPLLMDNFENNVLMVRRTVFYIVRSNRAGSQSLLDEVRQAVWSTNRSLPLVKVRTLEDVYGASLARTSFALVMLAIAGTMALLIGLVGIYAVMSYSVSQRTREIGMRMALGARRSEVTRMFVAHGFGLALVGVACGLVAAAGVTRVLASLLFGVNPVDPWTYAAVSAGLVLAAIVASLVPALRASAVDPVVALRAD